MNASRSPSSTACTLPVSYRVRSSLTSWYGASVYVRIWLPNATSRLSPLSASISLRCSSRCRSASRAARICIALARFWSCERSFWHDTTTPVGRCVMRTAESVTLTCWPPAPDER